MSKCSLHCYLQVLPNNTLYGGDGNDSLNGDKGVRLDYNGKKFKKVRSSGDDSLDGGNSNDSLGGGDGKDYLVGGNGNDVLNDFFSSNDTLVGGNGNDTLVGNESSLEGGSGNDSLEGGSGNDYLYSGNFSVYSVSHGGGGGVLSGNDYLSGGNGNDTLVGSYGSDTLTGNAGADTFSSYSPFNGIDNITDFVVADDTISVENNDFGRRLTPGAITTEQFVIGSAARDKSDRFIYNQNTGALYFDDDGTGATDQVQFATLSTGLAMTNADIVVVGYSYLEGEVGNDTLKGGQGNDNIEGKEGNDRLDGGEGNDLLDGGYGSDTLTGNAGADTFISDSPFGGIDNITDFVAADDTISVSAASINFNFDGGLTAVAMMQDQFVIGRAAGDKSDRFIYNQNTGALFFDADGIGATEQVQFATLSTGLVMTNANITVT